MRRWVMIGLLVAAACPAWAQTAPVRPDLPALIECRQRIGGAGNGGMCRGFDRHGGL